VGDAFDADEIARRLRWAEEEVRPLPLLTEHHPGLCWDDAREVARARDRLRREDGDEQIGYKLGWTSAVMREALGIERPNWGTLWESQRLPESVDARRFLHAKVEPELVYLCGHDLAGAVTTDQVTAACDGWALGLEVVDPRWPGFSFDWLDNTADNSSGAGVRCGGFDVLEIAPATTTVEFHALTPDEEVRRDGVGADAMGDPLEAVTWLVHALAEEGETVRAGQIVFTGGLTAPVDLVAGTTLRLSSEQLPTVELRT
jgi:2-keto-4-pentenoate hydratase